MSKKTGVVKTQEKKERWKEKKVVKRQKKDEEVVAEEEENVQPVVDPLENGFLHHAQREQERMNERLLKKTYSKKNKMVALPCHTILVFHYDCRSVWVFVYADRELPISPASSPLLSPQTLSLSL
ncbi:hypothetical protein EXN66_Car011794 [Channa argus]|uniref:Uncharacterized protein n=1 Tax=Channa argus TaxID=215402 RepID=A0A6G1Q1I8_CHAAH|nr:hypothetical protein EXN66_Car011794 [Channa argus]